MRTDSWLNCRCGQVDRIITGSVVPAAPRRVASPRSYRARGPGTRRRRLLFSLITEIFRNRGNRMTLGDARNNMIGSREIHATRASAFPAAHLARTLPDGVDIFLRSRGMPHDFNTFCLGRTRESRGEYFDSCRAGDCRGNFV